MSQGERRISLEDARDLYDEIVSKLDPFIHRHTPVGSVRRAVPTVGDIDLHVGLDPRRLPDLKARVFRLGDYNRGGDKLQVIDNVLGSGVTVEIGMIYPPRNWWSMLAIKTGPAEIQQWIRSRLGTLGVPRPHGEIQVTSEESFFEDTLRVDYIDPRDRSHAAWSDRGWVLRGVEEEERYSDLTNPI